MKNTNINSIYEGWDFIGTSAEGEEFYLPLKISVIRQSKKKIKELEQDAQLSEQELSEINWAKDILKSAQKRQFKFNWVFIIVMIGWIVAFYFMYDLNTPLSESTEPLKALEGDELEQKQQEMLKKEKEDVVYYRDKIVEREKILEDLEATPGTKEKKIKNAKKRVESARQFMEESEKFVSDVSPMEPEEFKKYIIKAERKDYNSRLGGLIVWISALAIYFVVNRRPSFLTWKNNKNQGAFETTDDVLGTVVNASLFNSLTNLGRSSIVYTRWSDGLVTKHFDITSFGVNIIVLALIFIIYMMFLVLSLPVRIIILFFRNFVFYI